MGADRGEDELVAVGRRVGDAFRSGHAARAIDVLDNDLLAEHFTHACGDQATENIGRSAGGERDHHGDRTAGEVFRADGLREYDDHSRRQRGEQSELHVGFPRVVSLGRFSGWFLWVASLHAAVLHPLSRPVNSTTRRKAAQLLFTRNFRPRHRDVVTVHAAGKLCAAYIYMSRGAPSSGSLTADSRVGRLFRSKRCLSTCRP